MNVSEKYQSTMGALKALPRPLDKKKEKKKKVRPAACAENGVIRRGAHLFFFFFFFFKSCGRGLAEVIEARTETCAAILELSLNNGTVRSDTVC